MFLLLAVVALAALARKVQTPYPIVLVLGGLLLGFVPLLPKVSLNPDIIFFVVLPPLLYSAAWTTSWRDFQHNIISILLLAVGLVAFTVFGVAYAGPYLLPGFDWRVGFVLGAVVATTDSIAATSIARRIGLPKRIVEILEGESLVNDATGLLALEFGTAMLIDGEVPTIQMGLLRLLYLAAAGIVVGLAIAWIVEWVENQIDDAPLEISISFFVPYAAYLGGELIHASGVLSVVAAGLFLGKRSSGFFSPNVRLQVNAVWNSLTFILNGFVFLTIGLQLPYVLDEIKGWPTSKLFLYAGLFSAFLIVLRLVWTFPGAAVSYFIRTRWLHQPDQRPGAKQVFVIGWTGMRGVIALAAAISLPESIPQRSLIIFLTFFVIVVTLVVQGLTLPSLIRALGLASLKGEKCEADEARRLVVEAALKHLLEHRSDVEEVAAVEDDIALHYRHRLANLQPGIGPSNEDDAHTIFQNTSRELLKVERETALSLRREGRISSEILREIERDLDLSETRMNSVSD